MKDFIACVTVFLSTITICCSLVLGIAYLSSLGKNTLLYDIKTPYGNHTIQLATFSNNGCSETLNNLINKTNYRCEDSFQVSLKYLRGKYK